MKKAIKIVFFLIFAVAIGIYGYRNSVRASVVEYESELDAKDYPKTLDSIKQIRRSLKGKSNAEIAKVFTNPLNPGVLVMAIAPLQ